MLKKKSTILSFFDESNTFFGSFGRYKGSPSYERSLYTTLFNAPTMLDRVLSKKSIILTKPRFNLCLLGHPKEYINLIRNDLTKCDDGLMHRFIVNAPKPIFYLAEDIRQANSYHHTLSLTCIFYLIMTIHEQERNYYFKDNIAIDNLYNKYKTFVIKLYNYDSFISSMFGKNIVYLLRFCGILQAFKNAFNTLKSTNITQTYDLTDEFKTFCNEFSQSVDNSYFCVDDETVCQAEKP